MEVLNTLLPDGPENLTRYHAKSKYDAKDGKYAIAGVLVKDKHSAQDEHKDEHGNLISQEGKDCQKLPILESSNGMMQR